MVSSSMKNVLPDDQSIKEDGFLPSASMTAPRWQVLTWPYFPRSENNGHHRRLSQPLALSSRPPSFLEASSPDTWTMFYQQVSQVCRASLFVWILYGALALSLLVGQWTGFVWGLHQRHDPWGWILFATCTALEYAWPLLYLLPKHLVLQYRVIPSFQSEFHRAGVHAQHHWECHFSCSTVLEAFGYVEFVRLPEEQPLASPMPPTPPSGDSF